MANCKRHNQMVVTYDLGAMVSTFLFNGDVKPFGMSNQPFDGDIMEDVVAKKWGTPHGISSRVLGV